MLGNFAAGAFMLVLRPFKVGDYVKVGGVEGTVMDLSMGGCIIKSDAPKMSDEQVFCEVVRRRGSVITYDGIRPSALRVRCNGMAEDDPAAWRELPTVERKDLYVF